MADHALTVLLVCALVAAAFYYFVDWCGILLGTRNIMSCLRIRRPPLTNQIAFGFFAVAFSTHFAPSHTARGRSFPPRCVHRQQNRRRVLGDDAPPPQLLL